MTARLDLTGTGLVVRDEAGAVVASLSWVDGVGEGALVVLSAGCEPREIPLDLDALKHLRGVAQSAHVNALCSAAAGGGEPCVPRRASVSDLSG